MRKNEELFHLIKSLSKSEKRHFKIFSGINGSNNNYLRLFEAVAIQQEYDEQAIRKKFQGEVFLTQLTTTKNYLKNLILKFLRVYHSEVSKEGIIKDTLRNVEILYQKGLYQLSRFEADKAFKLASEFEIFTSQYEAMAWKKKILQAEDPQQLVELSEIAGRQAEIATILSEYTNAWTLNIKLEEGIDTIEIREDEPLQLKMFKKLFLFQQKVKSGKPEEAVHHLQFVIDEYDRKPYRKMEEAETYLILLNNLLALYVFSKNYELAVPLINRIKSFIRDLKNYGAPVFKTLLRTLNIELEIYRESKDLHNGIRLIREIDVHLQNKHLPVPPTYRISFWYQFANIHFLSGQYREALKWINILLDNRNTKLRKDLITYSHWLNLMVHFELKNFFVLRYFVESTRRFLKKRKKIEGYEEQLLKMFTKVTKIPKNEIPDVFGSIYVKLQTNEYAIPEMVLDYVDFNRWLKEKAAINSF